MPPPATPEPDQPSELRTRDDRRSALRAILVGWTAPPPVVANVEVDVVGIRWLHTEHAAPSFLVLGSLAVTSLPAARYASFVVASAPIVLVSTGISAIGNVAAWLRVPGIEFVAPTALAEHLTRCAASLRRRPPDAFRRFLCQMALDAARHRGERVEIADLDPAFLEIVRALPAIDHLTNVDAWCCHVRMRPAEVYGVCRRAVGLATKDVLSDYLCEVAMAAAADGALSAVRAASVGFADRKGLARAVARALRRRADVADAQPSARLRRTRVARRREP